MASLALQDFGGNVIGGAADGPLLLAVELEFGGQAEVSQLEFHLVREEEVAEFEVAVDDFVALQLAHARNDLHHLALHLNLGQPFASAHLFVDGLVGAELQQNVDLLRVFKEVVEAHHVGMVQ